MKNRKNLYIAVILAALPITCLFSYKLGVSQTKERQLEKAVDTLHKQTAELAEKASFTLDKQKMQSIENVMIVAHPDDEILWGGSQLFDDGGYLVVCITNGTNDVRRTEFQKAMKKAGAYGVMLTYPDNPNHKKSNWKDDKQEIQEDIRYLLSYKKFHKIVTHNPEGEYGHIQHRTLNRMVTEECMHEKIEGQLYYFNHYYSDKELLKMKEDNVSAEDVKLKQEIMKNIYKSQKSTYEVTKKMIPYESLIPYEDWYFIR